MNSNNNNSNNSNNSNDNPCKRGKVSFSYDDKILNTYNKFMNAKEEDKPVFEIIEDLYKSFGFRWCCGLESEIISQEVTDQFKADFGEAFNRFYMKFKVPNMYLKTIFKNFTNSDMFEIIYYRTNPKHEHNPDEIYEGITQNDHLNFIETFWEAIEKICSFHKEKLKYKVSTKTQQTCIRNMTR